MFNIDNIFVGWFKFHICDSENQYDISYLSSVKEELDYVFNLNHNESKSVVLEMESLGDLLVQTYRGYDTLILTIVELYTDRMLHETHRLDYKKFVSSYIDEMETNKRIYLKEFNMNGSYSDMIWDSEDYLSLRNK